MNCDVVFYLYSTQSRGWRTAFQTRRIALDTSINHLLLLLPNSNTISHFLQENLESTTNTARKTRRRRRTRAAAAWSRSIHSPRWSRRSSRGATGISGCITANTSIWTTWIQTLKTLCHRLRGWGAACRSPVCPSTPATWTTARRIKRGRTAAPCARSVSATAPTSQLTSGRTRAKGRTGVKYAERRSSRRARSTGTRPSTPRGNASFAIIAAKPLNGWSLLAVT